ncbi:MAG TPA: hypothetical protein PLP11_04065 [Bacteroidales bacterium]|nr:hypothetical protein [Bacteroidales bacterium]
MKLLLFHLLKIIVLADVFISACAIDNYAQNYSTDKEIMYHSNEIAALNDIFLDFIGIEYYYEPWPIEYAPPRPPGLGSTREDSLRYERNVALASEFYKTAKRKKNRNNLIVSVDDTLIAFTPIPTLLAQLINYIPDTSYFHLINSTNTIPSVPWNIASLSNTGRYIIKNEPFFSEKSDNQLICSFQFSRIYFDNTFTKGYLLVNVKNNALAGKWILFLFKHKNKWVIQKRIFLN